MGTFSMAHWIVVALVILVLFGPGKISQTLGDFGKGIGAFRRGLSDESSGDGSEQVIDANSPNRPIVRQTELER